MFLTPFITGRLGVEAYGFISMAKDFSYYAAIITSTVNSFAARYIAIDYHAGNIDKANTYFSSVFWGDLGLGTGIFGLAALLSWNLDKLIRIPSGMAADVKWLFLLMSARFFLLTACAVFECAAYVTDKLDLAGVFKTLSYALEGASLYFLFRFLEPHMYYVGIGLFAASTIMAAGHYRISEKYMPELCPRMKDFSLQALKTLVLDGIWSAMTTLGDALNNGLDLLICNLMLSPIEMGEAAVAKTIHTMLSGIFAIISPAFHPMFLKSYASGKKEEFLGELSTAMKLSGMASNIAFAGFAALGPVFLGLWLPGQDTAVIYRLAMINCVTLVASGPLQPLYYIYTLTLKKKIPCLVTFIGGAMNVAGMFLLIRHTKLGVDAVMVTTAIVSCAIGFVFNPLYMAHVTGISPKWFYKHIIMNLVSCMTASCLFFMARRLYLPQGWIPLAGTAAIYTAAGAAVQSLILFGRESIRKASLALLSRDKAS